MRYRIMLWWEELQEMVQVDEACTKPRALIRASYYEETFPHIKGHIADDELSSFGQTMVEGIVHAWGVSNGTD